MGQIQELKFKAGDKIQHDKNPAMFDHEVMKVQMSVKHGGAWCYLIRSAQKGRSDIKHDDVLHPCTVIDRYYEKVKA